MSSNDKKKLLGAIIGVLAFGAVIAGATYAWLSAAATVTNGTYTASTKKFIINYTKGTDISNIKTVKSTDATPENTTHLAVTAKQGSGLPGNLTITLNTTSDNTLTTSGLVHYAVCKGTCSSFASTSNTINAKGNIDLITADPITAGLKTYNIYFWLEDANLNDYVGQTYSGNISASAVQTQS